MLYFARTRIFVELFAQVEITDRAIDPRKVSFIKFELNGYQVFDHVLLELSYAIGTRAKLYGLYMFSCCEDLRAATQIVS